MIQKISTSPRTVTTPAAVIPALFRNPPHQYGPVPFWWWVGERLDRNRLAWQLDQLCSKGVRNAIISYNHQIDGTISTGDPPVFSAAWWDLFRWIVAQCKTRGMQIGFQDYTIINPLIQEIGRAVPNMRGGQLRHADRRVRNGERCRLKVDSGCPVISASAIRMDSSGDSSADRIDLTAFMHNAILDWNPPPGDWLATLIFLEPNAFDPMHPEAGTMVIERLYECFEQHCPGELGKTISLFFQDELDFGARMPLWSDRLLTEFKTRKGYDLQPVLPALWHNIGPITPKVRIDYSDVVTTLLEESYFIPVFRWHEVHGTMLANDNLGRGGIEVGRMYYGDYFRTMRWFTAPGTDDPDVNGTRAFKGLKVNSSIAHLYGRKRVWNECFHSSGWGATPAQIIAALNQDFVYGATVVNLHGLYYSTHGSWWEWASPDFHFRQPYWTNSGHLNAYILRLSYILSQGTHVCDVAMVYPITAIEGGLNPRVTSTDGPADSYSERQRGMCSEGLDAAEAQAFGTGKYLFDNGIDFDFVDFQSLECAVVEGEQLNMAAEAYRVLILPMMSSIRFNTLVKTREFFMAGGTVIAIGCLPRASDRMGLDDAEVAQIVRDIFGVSASGDTPTRNLGHAGGRGIFIPGDDARVKQIIDQFIVRDFIPRDAPLQTVHRKIGNQNMYLVFNPLDKPVESDVFFRTPGHARRWNAMTGDTSEIIPGNIADDGTRLRLNLEALEAQLIVFCPRDDSSKMTVRPMPEETEEILDVSGLWDFSITPTMDNRFGDFRLPIRRDDAEICIGAEARRFRYAEEKIQNPPWHDPAFDDAGWPLVTFSFGPRFWRLGPMPPDADLTEIERQLAEMSAVSPEVPVVVNGRAYFWSPYEISLRWGIENDPFLKNWASGPHGLKMMVPDEFIDLDCGQPGAVWYLFSTVQSSMQRPSVFKMGSRSAYTAWLNGHQVLKQAAALPPGFHAPWNLPHYDSDPKECIPILNIGDNSLLFRFVQSSGQRTRAYAVFDSPPRTNQLALRWFTDTSVPRFNYRPQEGYHAGWYRFLSPPGLAALTVTARGVPKIWIDGKEHTMIATSSENPFAGDAVTYRVRISHPVPHPATVAIRIQQESDSFAGDALPEPVKMECITGLAPLGDWSQFGLAAYSGMATYQRNITLAQEQAQETVVLDLGNVAVTASVRVNGIDVGNLIAPPWKLNISDTVRAGDNRLEISIANTLANHYSVGIPTPYVLPGQTVSGLLGPVRLIITKCRKGEDTVRSGKPANGAL